LSRHLREELLGSWEQSICTRNVFQTLAPRSMGWAKEPPSIAHSIKHNWCPQLLIASTVFWWFVVPCWVKYLDIKVTIWLPLAPASEGTEVLVLRADELKALGENFYPWSLPQKFRTRSPNLSTNFVYRLVCHHCYDTVNDIWGFKDCLQITPR